MSLDTETRARIDALLQSNPVTLFMKGTRDTPQCGFSMQVVEVLDRLVANYATVDVLSDPEIREGIKEFSDWPTIPQLYVGGEFMGGCDIIKEMHASGELHQALGLESPAEVGALEIAISTAALAMIGEALAQSEHPFLHVKIDARFHHSLGFGPRDGGEIEVVVEGLTLLVDPDSAARAQGLRIDVASEEEGRGLVVDNPNQPKVKQISARELKRRIDAGEAPHLFDLRTPEEAAKAAIEGARIVDEAVAAEIEAMPRDTFIVFHCHHGGRSQRAAEHFAAQGHRNVHNLEGGIDTWSLEVDPSLPRY